MSHDGAMIGTGTSAQPNRLIKFRVKYNGTCKDINKRFANMALPTFKLFQKAFVSCVDEIPSPTVSFLSPSRISDIYSISIFDNAERATPAYYAGSSKFLPRPFLKSLIRRPILVHPLPRYRHSLALIQAVLLGLFSPYKRNKA